FCIINERQKIQADYNPETIGMAFDTNIFHELDYHLWQLGEIKENCNISEFLLGAYYFSEVLAEKNNLLENLFNRLYQMTKKSSLITGALISSWEDFIDDPVKIIDAKTDKYCDWFVSGVLENRSTFEQFLRFKDLKKVCLSLDFDINNPKMQENRKKAQKANDVFISSEAKKEFLEADEEVNRFVNSTIAHFQRLDKAHVLGQEVDADKKEILSFFNSHKKEYPYLNLFAPSIIGKLYFEPGIDPNTFRNNSRAFISALKKRLGYKNFKTTKLTKLLGLETGTQKYIRWAK
ncbi:MAG: hypothetical protein GY760_01705, partial [Deltaproteobacteria bacterium]|nr:hypothetical protein [Deltaproteobacteria bacterium]